MHRLGNWLQRNILTILADVGLVWVLVYFGLGGWRNGWLILRQVGLGGWLLLAGVVLLLVYGSDYRRDVPLFAAGVLLGYWGEWWGTTRGVWTYWNGATPPVYLPPLWGLGLLSVERLSRLLRRSLPELNTRAGRSVALALLALPLAATLAHSWPRLVLVDWRGRLDLHFFAGLAAALYLVGRTLRDPQAGLRSVLAIYLCGMLLGGFYEYMGTSWGEWAYITAETPPLWIAPLWGYACVAMFQLAELLRAGLSWILQGHPAPLQEAG